jgi:hypothetical protein
MSVDGGDLVVGSHIRHFFFWEARFAEESRFVREREWMEGGVPNYRTLAPTVPAYISCLRVCYCSLCAAAMLTGIRTRGLGGEGFRPALRPSLLFFPRVTQVSMVTHVAPRAFLLCPRFFSTISSPSVPSPRIRLPSWPATACQAMCRRRDDP